MLSNSHHHVRPTNEAERAYLESLIREDFERCHPGETLDDVKRRASFSKRRHGASSRLDGHCGNSSCSESTQDATRSPPDGTRLRGTNHAAGRTPKSFGLSIRSASVYLSRTAVERIEPLMQEARKRQLRVMMH